MGSDKQIGIWKIRENRKSEIFIRDPARYREYSHWAWTLSFSLNKEHRRVVYIGDSVGMGHYYRPHFSPAIVLEKMMEDNFGKTEVIDLSKDNLMYHTLIELILSSLKLNPDLIILFLGDILWKDDVIFTEAEKQAIFADMSESINIEKIQTMILQKVNPLLENLMKVLGNIKCDYKIPVLFILPEQNLKNWDYAVCNPFKGYYGKKAETWEEYSEKAKLLLQYKNYSEAKATLKKMTAMNSINLYPYEMLAEIYRAERNYDKEMRYLKKIAVLDLLSGGNTHLSCPNIRMIVRRLAKKFDVDILDIRKIFFSYSKDKIFGKEFFLNAYHLNDYGIKCVMGGILDYILDKRLIQAERKKRKDLDSLDENRMVLGRAYLLSAIDSGQKWNQPYERLLEQCVLSVNYWPKALRAFQLYIEIATSGIPWYLHKHYTELTKFDLWPAFPESSMNNKNVALDIIKAMDQVIRQKDKGNHIELADLWMAGYGSVDGKLDLLQQSYRTRVYGNNRAFFMCTENNIGYMEAFSPETEFYLFADSNNDISVDLTISSPIAKKLEVKACILLNNKCIGQPVLTEQWSHYSFKISREILHDGAVQRLKLKWPIVEFKHIYGREISVYGRIFECLVSI